MARQVSKVAIVGAGPSGLAACKAALEEGLCPTVFERARGVGGLWRNDESGKVWNSLQTNLSKFTCAFSDAPWQENAPDFPSGQELQEYLEAYASSNLVLPHIKLNTEVVALQPVETGGWQVTFKDISEPEPAHTLQTFDYAIVAAGIFSKPHQVAGLNADKFSGKTLHASGYREPTGFSSQRVLVVGSSFSGADIAADIAGHAKSVTIAAGRPLWYLPRYIAGKPADLAFYSRAASKKGQDLSAEERNLKRHNFFASIVPELPSPLPTPDPAAGDLPFVAITDQFVNAVKEKKIVVHPSKVVNFEEQTVIFADGHREDFDVVIMATGYNLDLPFFSEEALAALEFHAGDLLQPIILHECVWRPEFPGLAFVGVYRGPYFAAMELQARWACGVFSGRLAKPSADEMLAGLETERQIRHQKPRPQFPHGDYVGMVEALACQVKVHPIDILDDESHPLHSLLYNGPLLPFHYRLVGFGAKQEVAEAAIQECATKFEISPS